MGRGGVVFGSASLAEGRGYVSASWLIDEWECQPSGIRGNFVCGLFGRFFC